MVQYIKLVFLCVILMGCSSTKATSIEMVEISGVLVDRATKEKIRELEVTVTIYDKKITMTRKSDPQIYLTHSDEDGEFKVSIPRQLYYEISVYIDSSLVGGDFYEISEFKKELKHEIKIQPRWKNLTRQ